MIDSSWDAQMQSAGDGDDAADLHAARRAPLLFAKFRASNGSTLDLAVLDISAAGCMVEKTFRAFQEGERVLIKLPGLSFMPAQVVWIEETTAGITFEHTLHDAVLTHLKGSGARSRLS